jgi:tetratricopeptide (TPR) repeat protein
VPDHERVTLLRDALALWRAEALAGLTNQWAVRMRDVWHREKLDAVIAWAHAELRVGKPDAVIGPLTELIEAHPLVEPLAAVLLRALCAAGRGAEALRLYATIRTLLRDELGADPGPELQELHGAILRGEFDPAAPLPAAPVTPVPAQLPLDIPAFTGRAEHLRRLAALLDDQSGRAGVTISTIAGTAGVGKTALAVHWAHQISARFPDGQLYVNLRGFDPSGSVMTPAEAIRGFLDAFGVPQQKIPADLPAQAALYRSVVSGKRVLVVLDNARNAEQVRPLLPGSPGCLVLVTSRNQLTSLVAAEGAQPLPLDLLTTDEARQLLTHRLGRSRVQAEPDSINEIIARCARLPLALSIVAARAATHPRLPVARLAGELRDARGGLDALDAGDAASNVRAVFSRSYEALAAPAARLFRLLGLHPGPDIAAPAAASLAGLPADAARALLTELTGAHMVAEQATGRYAFHDLLRSYASDLARSDASVARREPGAHDDVDHALRRMLDHYLHSAHTAALALNPARRTVALAPVQTGVTPEAFGDAAQALAWFSSEHAVLLGVVDLAARTGFDTHAWQLARTLTTYFNRQGHWRDWVATQRIALAAARRLAERAGQAHIHRDLGLAYVRLARYEDARTEFAHALDLYDELGDTDGQGNTYLDLADMCLQQDRPQETLEHCQRSLALYRRTGNRIGQASALNSLGWAYSRVGEHRQALHHCHEALVLQREIGDPWGLAATWHSIGYAHHQLGRHREAIACYENTLEFFPTIGDRYYEATTLTHLGDSHYAAHDCEPARAAWQRAATILDQLAHPDADQVRAKLRQLRAR